MSAYAALARKNARLAVKLTGEKNYWPRNFFSLAISELA
jgi:hypothetical protein